MAFDFSTLQNRIDQVLAQPAGVARGKALETLIGEVLGALPGVRILARNVLSGSGEAEFDIQFGNEQLEDGLPAFGRDFFSECKSSEDALGSAGVQHFAAEMLKRRILWSIIVSLKGITGTTEMVNAAQRQIADYALQGSFVMVLDETELRGIRSAQHLAAVIERKRWEQVGKRTASKLSDVEVAALNPELVRFSGRRGIERALREARDGVIDEILKLSEALPAVDDSKALARVDEAAASVRQEIAQRKDDPELDPLWLSTRQRILDLAATLVPLLPPTYPADIDVLKTMRFEVNHTAPQRLGAHVGSDLWRLLVEHYLTGIREEPEWRSQRNIYALVSLIVEEVGAIDSIDPVDVFDYYEDEDLYGAT